MAILLISCNSLYAQIWQPGYYTDVSGVKYYGIIRPCPGGKGPFPGEGYIEFKDSEKGEVMPLTTRDVKWFVAGQDSFVVAKQPAKGKWSSNPTDFLRVVMNEEVKVYALRVADGKPATYKGSGHTRKTTTAERLIFGGLSADRNSAIAQNPTVTKDGLYKGAANYTLPVFPAVLSSGPSNRGSSYNKWYYYGNSPNEMQYVTDDNFQAMIALVMQAQPKLVEYIKANPFGLDNIEQLITYFYKTKAEGKF
ncbi:hypothetical protein [Mucilaginibacter psychrotolerans]|uniref:Uncharacterized protein n=1 Tax=Mucilaginibacter psychrotolerans TaxID=1524096 RepID=A0A4Y8SCQ0_9SPHI|nr:hypothetical protein [Mucilaginibacter psychrotolerans]TFF36692.1 hypothetical protein E2R66_14665 [Mucilaginibacter psychrotolerans]